MATYKTRAIILSSYPYREHDRIITFFSDEFGKMEARARGLRKITSKLAGHLEPFIETQLLLANGRRWDILAGSRTINTHEKIRSNVACMASASVCAEAVKHITKPLSREAHVFELLKAVLRDLEDNVVSNKEHEHQVSTFLWRLLALSGFRAELTNCINCRTIVGSGGFSFEGGGMLCEQCKARDILSADVDGQTLEKLQKFDLQTPASQKIAAQFWNRIVDHHPLKSLDFFKALNANV